MPTSSFLPPRGGAHGQSTTRAKFPYADGPFYGIEPFSWYDGSLLVQGSNRSGKPWITTDYKITAVGGAGTTLAAVDTAFPNAASFITRATADGDGYNIQFSEDAGSNVRAVFVPTANTVIAGYIRLKMTNAALDAHTKSKFVFGIGDADTSIFASVSKFVGIYKAAGAATYKGIIDDTGQTLSSASARNSIVNNTYIQLGFRLEGVSTLDIWSGTGTRLSAMKVEPTCALTTMTNLPTAPMALSLEGLTSEAAAITYTVATMCVVQGYSYV